MIDFYLFQKWKVPKIGKRKKACR